ncbi:nucleoside hydrolase [Lactiplantibacillus mudanjiangensis]|uniref:Nucleoside hydrolase [Lactobacillus paraplantarum] n=1 Tax=Lactiplantibacillus mudanjiangensis TaxID=1296538 RepID=A0A660E319_9LACO|nr:nucleoside hydrolase [Lactiplantibacillus mudanjiangensis]VDG20022.1 nucleoside hydrolase [Lactobacillus paraplantarum] [Lactiplantibacillus mudanjiangensis]VDG26183.1 nucleoside hydrolase [Lactobacillus paraplantarum] [Lactiplantibacillus mudanjiangensis]VDG27338.1 nucleoside hydrolase [Lactobacillus paraplantarum] [Lactiplantibacillus mudanjiangensis]VDG33419.1 nucleoside hydrolase [Lactobacillus paraplantarum] [Lactiplantibacillus mudanjiangensis]
MNAARNVIIDCDPGIDDSLAILLALNSPELNVVGITTVCGNVPTHIGAENALKILALADRLDIPVFMGENRPLEVAYTSAQDTHGDDGLGNSQIPAVTKVHAAQDGVAFIERTLTEEPTTSILALGPLTNIAQVLQRDAHLFDQVDRFVLMGGNYRSHGNCSPVAEYNFWCDPDAAKLTFDLMPVPIEMVGLDVTRKIVLTPSILEYMRAINPEMGQFIAKITRFYFDFHWEYERVIGCVINDPLAVAAMIDPEILGGFDAYTTVVATDDVARGQSIVDDHDFWHRANNSHIMTDVDVNTFWRLFLSRVVGATDPDLSTTLHQLLGGHA